jgi:hypothetical protein
MKFDPALTRSCFAAEHNVLNAFAFLTEPSMRFSFSDSPEFASKGRVNFTFGAPSIFQQQPELKNANYRTEDMSKAKRDLEIGNSLPVALNTYRNSNLCPGECSPKYDGSGEAWKNHLTTRRSLWTHFVLRASSHLEWATPRFVCINAGRNRTRTGGFRRLDGPAKHTLDSV